MKKATFSTLFVLLFSVQIFAQQSALRINTGGSAIDYEGETFMTDTYFNEGLTLVRPQTGLPEPYQSFRYSRSQQMSYDIPIEDGEYTVNLYFAELWFGATGGGAGGVGNRIFDVTIEGSLAEDNLDVFANVGAETLLTRTHTVNVTDGQLDIDFSSLASDGGSRHPIINAIEILEPISLQEEDDLVGHWPLDERNGTNANDLSGQGKTGKLENGLTFDTNRRSGQIEGALAFDGLDDRINLSDINDDLGSNFSVSAWVKPGNANDGQKLVSAGSIKNNVWQMITCTFDGSNMHWYINGEHIHSESLSGTLKAKSEAWIGWSGWRDEFFQGVIDDVRLFNSAITEQEVISLFEKDNLGTAPAYLALADNPSQPSTTAENAQVSHVFPNPTVDKFKIAGLSDSVKTITVTDFTGFTVITAETDEIEPQLDLSAYPDGIYFVRVLQNGLEQSFKVVKD